MYQDAFNGNEQKTPKGYNYKEMYYLAWQEVLI